jgi:hypothetical protein
LEKIVKKFDLFGIQTHPIPLNPHGLRANRTSPKLSIEVSRGALLQWTWKAVWMMLDYFLRTPILDLVTLVWFDATPKSGRFAEVE